MMLAGVITAFLLGAVSMSLSQLSQSRTRSRMHLEAHLRADTALSALRRNIASVLRDEDLFWTRLLLTDGATSTPIGVADRDEILVFNTRLRPIRDLDFVGDGMEFETQFRIEEDALGPVLWQRRDAVPDEYPRGGGVATPLVPGVISLSMEAYDGDLWYQDWDSDIDGLPLAVRATVIATGQSDGEDILNAPLATLRTVIPIDRVRPPVEESEPELPLEGEQEEGGQTTSGGTEAGGTTGRRSYAPSGTGPRRGGGADDTGTTPGGGGQSSDRGSQ
jgi:hypothetical protein